MGTLLRRVRDFAYGLPAFQGQPAHDAGRHNYQQLTTEEAIHNAESYNLVAEHVTLGRDTRPLERGPGRLPMRLAGIREKLGPVLS